LRSSEFSIDCFSMTPSPMSLSTSSCCDFTGAIAKLEGDVELLRELAAMFIETLPDRLGELQAAMVEDCPRKISDAAHSIKGSVRYFLADSAYAAAQHLELVSISGKRSDIDRGCDALLCEVERLRSELVTAIQSNGPCFRE
jgi:two-component system sensor histidine kinase/response regulator